MNACEKLQLSNLVPGPGLENPRNDVKRLGGEGEIKMSLKSSVKPEILT